MRRVYVSTTVIALTLLLQACTSSHTPVSQNQSSGALMTSGVSMMDHAVGMDHLRTFVRVVRAAGLEDLLSGPGPFIVFAPTDAAFDALPAGTLDALLKPENKTKLAGVLKYHIVSGQYAAARLADGTVLRSLQGSDIRITRKDGKVFLNDMATIQMPDILSGNGVIAMIDSVLLPK